MEGVCATLNRKDVMAILPTGSWKTGLFFMFMLVVLGLLEKPELCPQKKVPENPLMLAICPANYLKNQTVCHKFTYSSMTFSL
jgi:hypothetical protein